MKKLKRIWVDKSTPYAIGAFSGWAQVILYEGGQFPSGQLKAQDGIIVRSVTKINEKTLLEYGCHHPVFVATATSGTDHIDKNYLQKEKIPFFDAHGCNARSVAEYFLEVLVRYACENQWRLWNKKIAVIGCGEVGEKIIHFAQTLKMNAIAIDPPLEKKIEQLKLKNKISSLSSFEADLIKKYEKITFHPTQSAYKADIITLHTSLTYPEESECSTFHLLNESFFTSLTQKPLIINACRGKVIEEKALIKAFKNELIQNVILDVFDHEPYIDSYLIQKAWMTTSHVAGYSFDGRVNASIILYKKLLNYGFPINLKNKWNENKIIKNQIKKEKKDIILIDEDISHFSIEKTLLYIFDQHFSFLENSKQLKDEYKKIYTDFCTNMNDENVKWKQLFKSLREKFGGKFEWINVTIKPSNNINIKNSTLLRNLGFSLI